jgi:REP-associated tyrosine transposase
MPRRARAESTTGLYHVTCRGAAGEAVYLDDFDRTTFLGILARTVHEAAWRLYAYCLMSNHYHLLLRAAEKRQLSEGVRLLNTRYASRFRSRHHRCGPLFGQRFASQPVEDEAHLLLAAVYVVLNPVRAGLTRSADSWPWSSYCASARLADRPHWLSPIAELAIFGEDEREADLRFCRMLEDAQLKFTGTVPFVDSPPGRSRTIGTVTQSESVRRFQSYS